MEEPNAAVSRAAVLTLRGRSTPSQESPPRICTAASGQRAGCRVSGGLGLHALTERSRQRSQTLGDRSELERATASVTSTRGVRSTRAAAKPRTTRRSASPEVAQKRRAALEKARQARAERRAAAAASE